MLWMPIDLDALMTGAVVRHDSGPWPTLPHEDPLDEVRRLSGRTAGRSPVPATPPSATVPRRTPPLAATEGVQTSPVVATPAVAPTDGVPTPNQTSHDTLRWLVVACLIASLPLAYVAWTDCTRGDESPTVPHSGDMMRRTAQQRHPEQRS
jgi:hypothetical protein